MLLIAHRFEITGKSPQAIPILWYLSVQFLLDLITLLSLTQCHDSTHVSYFSLCVVVWQYHFSIHHTTPFVRDKSKWSKFGKIIEYSPRGILTFISSYTHELSYMPVIGKVGIGHWWLMMDVGRWQQMLVDIGGWQQTLLSIVYLDKIAKDVYFTHPHILQLDSTWNTTKSVYFWIIQLESMWSLHRLQMDSTQIQLNLNKEVFKIETSRLQ